MKNVFTFCCALCLLALTACGSAPKISEEASDLEVNNHEGVTMTVVDGSAYPGQVKVTILNATDTEIDSGNSADFFLQVEQDGQWYDLEENGDFSNTAEAYIFEKTCRGRWPSSGLAATALWIPATTGRSSGFSSFMKTRRNRTSGSWILRWRRNLTLNSLASGFPFPDSDGCKKLLNDYPLSRADIL